MSQILEKRTVDNRTFDIDCSLLLQPTETIVSVTSIAADQGNLAFGIPQVNVTAITYSNGTTADVGKVVQVEISGGVIPVTTTAICCTIRAVVATNQNPAIEATVQLRVTNTLDTGFC